MEMNQSTSALPPSNAPESVSQSSPSVTERTPAAPSPASTTPSAPEREQSGIEIGNGQAADPAAPPAPYQPNFKFKVMDKEHEVPEWLRAAIKDEKTNKEAIELFEKAYGLDHVKPKYKQTREEFQALKGTHEGLTKQLKTAGHYLKNGDLDSYFDYLQINPQYVMQWAIEKAQYSQLDENGRRQYDERNSARRRAIDLELRQGELESSSQSQLQELFQEHLNMALERPDVQTFKEQFNARVGNPNAFMEEVAMRGEAIFQRTGKNPPPHQVIQEVMRLYGHSVQSAAAPAPAAPTNNPGQAAPQAPAKPPVIPHVSGRNASPTNQVSKSIDDIRKAAAALKD